jgi:excisionase family DNA binding protein
MLRFLSPTRNRAAWRFRAPARKEISMSQIERKAYTVNQFCEAFGIGRTKIFGMIKAGELRSVKLGTRKTLIPASEGERLLATGE